MLLPHAGAQSGLPAEVMGATGSFDRHYIPLSWRPRLVVGIVLAVTYAFALSLQFLAQPFVWRNFPLGEIIEGWSYVFRDRLIIALAIAAAILAFSTIRSSSLALRTSLLATGVIVGAVAGELTVRRLNDLNAPLVSLAPQALRWGVIAFAMAATYYAWRASAASADRLREEILRRTAIEEQLTNTRLSALKSQIEPHFLFNTLATLRRLHHVEPSAGARMLADFIDYLRRVLPMLDRSEVSLGEEIDLVQAYLSVIQVRMLGRLKVTIDVPEILRTVLVPPLAVATIVENAVKHGITPSPTGGEIKIFAIERSEDVQISVVDTGVGLSPDGSSGTGIGLNNVRARLNTLHGVHAELRVESNEPTGVRATIRVPHRRPRP